MEKVLLFFSGGNDSTLSAYKLVSLGYEVDLVTFDNGCEDAINNIRNRAVLLKKMFSKPSTGKIVNLGVFQTVGEFINLRYQSANMNFPEIIKQYGDLNIKQLNCLTVEVQFI